MPQRARVAVMVAAILWAAVAGVATPAAEPAAPQGVLDLVGRPVNPLSVQGHTRAHVLVFTTTDCPISNRYAPEINRLAAAYAARGVGFWIVYPVPGDTPEKIRAHATQFGLNLPIARDTAFALVRHTGVTVTPEVAVIAPGGAIAYRGRVDDRYVDFGVDRPAPTTRDLDQALTNLLAGKPIEPKTTRAVGCFLPDLLK
jgi:Redoxin